VESIDGVEPPNLCKVNDVPKVPTHSQVRAPHRGEGDVQGVIGRRSTGESRGSGSDLPTWLTSLHPLQEWPQDWIGRNAFHQNPPLLALRHAGEFLPLLALDVPLHFDAIEFLVFHRSITSRGE
jgi:hypothetical protein